MAASFQFLYRESEGVIDRRAWWMAIWPPIAIVAAMTLLWVAIAPRETRDLGRESLFSFSVLAVHAYFIVYAFAVLLCAVAQYFVSAKRFSDRARPQGLAGLLPFALLVAGAANWYQPLSEGSMPEALTWIFDAIALGVAGWTIAELGFGESRKA
jgi:hypothetical protein